MCVGHCLGYIVDLVTQTLYSLPGRDRLRSAAGNRFEMAAINHKFTATIDSETLKKQVLRHTHTQTHTHTHTRTYTHVLRHTHARTHKQTNTDTHTQTHVRTHKHARMNAHTHTHTHIYYILILRVIEMIDKSIVFWIARL